jgi:hypothetical protein
MPDEPDFDDDMGQAFVVSGETSPRTLFLSFGRPFSAGCLALLGTRAKKLTYRATAAVLHVCG